MSKVNTNFKNVIPFTGWWVAKRVVGLESYLVEGDAYEIAHKTVGDNYGEYYCIGGRYLQSCRKQYLFKALKSIINRTIVPP